MEKDIIKKTKKHSTAFTKTERETPARIYDSKERPANQNGALASRRASAANQSPSPVLAGHSGKHTGRRSKPSQKLPNDSPTRKLKHIPQKCSFLPAQDQQPSAQDNLALANANPYQPPVDKNG